MSRSATAQVNRKDRSQPYYQKLHPALFPYSKNFISINSLRQCQILNDGDGDGDPKVCPEPPVLNEPS
jgi:hypothetical protein